MKNKLLLIIAICLFAALAACAEDETPVSPDTTDLPVINPAATATPAVQSAGPVVPVDEQRPQLGAAPQGNGVDVDLTTLSATIIMGEVNNMWANPGDYMGKTVKITGPYMASYYDETGLYYHYVVIDNCCAGLEFILNGDYTYPDDYPDNDTLIEVVGVFGQYDELGMRYIYLATDEITVLS